MKTPKKYNYKVTGFAISPEMDQCIRMYAHSQSVPISHVLRSIVRGWIKNACITEEILLNVIVTNAVLEWDKQKFLNPGADLIGFRASWRKELEKKLTSKTCDQIIIKFNEKLNPDEKSSPTTK